MSVIVYARRAFLRANPPEKEAKNPALRPRMTPEQKAQAKRDRTFARKFVLQDDPRESVGDSVTREERFLIAKECGVSIVEDGEGGWAYQRKNKQPVALAHNPEAARLLDQAQSESVRRANELARKRGFTNRLKDTRGGR